MKSVIKREQVQLAEAAGAQRKKEARATAPGAPAAASAGACAPRVRLVPGDGEPQLLEFTCSCGAVSLIEVQCEKKP